MAALCSVLGMEVRKRNKDAVLPPWESVVQSGRWTLIRGVHVSARAVTGLVALLRESRGEAVMWVRSEENTGVQEA